MGGRPAAYNHQQARTFSSVTHQCIGRNYDQSTATSAAQGQHTNPLFSGSVLQPVSSPAQTSSYVFIACNIFNEGYDGPAAALSQQLLLLLLLLPYPSPLVVVQSL
jgi:hypothetical protein